MYFLLVVYNFCRITHRFRDTSCLMLKTTFLPTPHVFDLEFQGHAVWNVETKLAPEN